MSFVSVILCDDYITVMADSRAVELYTDGSIHRIINDNSNKITQLSDNVFFVVNGIVEDAQRFIDKSNLQQTILENGKLKEKDALYKWYNSSLHYIIAGSDFRIQFGGLTIANELKVYCIESNEKN